MVNLIKIFSFNRIITEIDNRLWGWGLIILILVVGLYMTVRSKLVQVLHLGKALKFMVKNEEDGVGEVSSFGALCTALSATIGTGNIVGVATAICSGGPGALFWMLVAAFFGMATKYAEGLLAVKYRVYKGNGRFLGGPFYYIENGMGKKWKWLAKLFAFFGAGAGIMGIGTVAQINGITSAIQGYFDASNSNIAFCIGFNSYSWATVISGIIFTIFAALVIIGGIKRIAKVSGIIVPFMAVMYVVFTLVILLCNISKIPEAITLIVKSAFDVGAIGGAIIGLTIKTAMQKGIGRGIFSNEAGLGSAPIAAAAAMTKDPVRQGLVTMTGTLIDTIVICTLTGLTIIVTGAWNPAITGANLEGVMVTTYAWQNGLPWNPQMSSFLLMLCLIFFAFTSILGWNYYSERCLEYLTNGNVTVLKIYRWFYILAVFIGPYLTVSEVWGIADILNALMAFPNLIALIALGGVVAKETNEYFTRQHHVLK